VTAQISGGGNFIQIGGVHAGNSIGALDVEADTGRHSSVLDPSRTDGGTGTRHMASRGVHLCAGAIAFADPVTHRHDAVLLTLRESVQTTPEK
jgi:hypothetical protein